jgi:putative methionine-R-sulfoxide reductase with GAF domain
VKSYRPAADILAEIKGVLTSNRPAFHHSPLEKVTQILCDGRHYSWVGIYLRLDKKTSSPLLETEVHPGHVAVAGTRKKILVAMKIAGRELGFLNIESDRENAFGSVDRILLERVASLLARFLTGRGKYLVRRAGVPQPVPKAAAA